MKQIKTFYGTPFAIDDLVNEFLVKVADKSAQVLMSSSVDKSGVNTLPDVVVTVVYEGDPI